MRWPKLSRRPPTLAPVDKAHTPAASGQRLERHLEAITEAQARAAADLELIRREIELMRRGGH
jgi:hypothetical protein